MEKKHFRGKIVLTIVLTATATFLVTVVLLAILAWAFIGPGGLSLLESAAIINASFVGDYDKGTMIDGALTGMVDSLGDRWSVYLSPEAYAAQNQRRQNAYVGVGLTYQRDQDSSGMTIVEITEGAPAEKAGLQIGERIVAINGQSLSADNFETLTAQIAGEPGQSVTFTVEGADRSQREVTITLAQVETHPVAYQMLEDNIGYVRISNFFQRSAEETQAAVEDLQAQGAKALLFDVRANPGGYVDELTQMLDFLLPEGPIFAEHTKNGPVKVVQSDENCVDLPMAVLMNEDSYSAAELFAAQLRESVGAKLIGQTTCGKGYYQQAMPLPNGGALNLSTGVYTTGGGLSLIGAGLTPDVAETDLDAQLASAVALLKEG